MYRVGLMAIVALAGLVLAGCDQNEEWHGRDISGLMPPLEFELTGEDGEPLTEEAFRGQAVALFFGYTHCPDYCPATLSSLARALEQVPPEQRDDVAVLFVSVDPERDTPEHLREYTDYFSERITGATGDETALRKLAKRYRTTFSYEAPDDNGDYLVSHGQAIYLFDKAGEVRLMVLDDQPPEAIAADLARLAAE